MNRTDVIFGIKAHMGWITCVSFIHGPRIIRIDRVITGDDRLSTEPYHVAGGLLGLTRVPPPDNPGESLRGGIKQQKKVTKQNFNMLIDEMSEEGFIPAEAVILEGRGKQSSTLEKVLASHTQIHIAEGLEVRRSVEEALINSNIPVTRLDEKSLATVAEKALELTEEDLFAKISDARTSDLKPWQKEQKLCALASWLISHQGE